MVNNRYITSTADMKQKGVLAAFVDIARSEGLGGLYRGLLPSLILVSNPIITYTLYQRLSQVGCGVFVLF